MDEQVDNKRWRRKPYIAVILSLLEPGLGHIYCGKISRGFILIFIYSIVLPYLSATLAISKSCVRMEIFIVSIFLSVAMWIAVAVDSYCSARRVRPDYELKDYNRWYLYLILILITSFGTSRYNERLKANIVEAFHMPEEVYSMFPTLEGGDLFITNKIAYESENPQRGDIVVFVPPVEQGKNYVQRVVAVAGDTVEVKENQLIINGEKLERVQLYTTTYIGKDINEKDVNVEGNIFVEKNDNVKYEIFLLDTYGSIKYYKWEDLKPGSIFPETKIPANHCFVLGDNRNLSKDSRHFGPVPLSTIKGRAEYLYWPAKGWSRFGKLK